ncbi:hypothetical protein D9757_002928 [Collybiopsis confluens]|uniref:Uncharacterized protein n=1 Tax=Collybiopsis confluens TaxID=2823264 RepID=A0A8H5HVW4_9AGAR|nr:hypothetical protein D9757_002928 [Collybiopsis confluens]
MGEPKIGGSVAGFIVLIVCLILVIIASCTASFFLLRKEASEDEEGATRRRRYLHPNKPYAPSSTGPSQSWFNTLRNLFIGITHSVGYKTARRTKAREGWIQAGDDWDDHADHPEQLMNMRNTHYTAVPPAIDPPFHAPAMTSAESSPAIYSYDYHSGIPNRFASSPEYSPPSTFTPLPPTDDPIMPRSIIPESVSPPQALTSTYIGNDNRKDSLNSNISTGTFGIGTKFVEGL